MYFAQPDKFAFRALLLFLHSKEIPAQRRCEREKRTVAPNETKDQSGISCGGSSEQDKQHQ